MVSYQKEETPKTGNLVDKPGALFFTMRKYAALTKTRNDLKQPEMIYNDLKQSETNWNNLQRARNDLKRPTTSKKWLEMTYLKQPEIIWNNLESARNNVLFTCFLNWFQTFSIWYILWVLPLTAHLRVGEAVLQCRNFVKAGSVRLSAAPVAI